MVIFADVSTMLTQWMGHKTSKYIRMVPCHLPDYFVCFVASLISLRFVLQFDEYFLKIGLNISVIFSWCVVANASKQTLGSLQTVWANAWKPVSTDYGAIFKISQIFTPIGQMGQKNSGVCIWFTFRLAHSKLFFVMSMISILINHIKKNLDF